MVAGCWQRELLAMSSEWLLLSDVARELRVPIATVRHWIKTRKLASSRPGRRRLVNRDDLDALIASSHKPAVDVGARGLTHRGGNPGRLTPTADPSVDGGREPEDGSKGGEDRPGLAGGEPRSGEGAQPPGPGAQGTPRSGARARIREARS
jgi:excisionase family DNA binding protein